MELDILRAEVSLFAFSERHKWDGVTWSYEGLVCRLSCRRTGKLEEDASCEDNSKKEEAFVDQSFSPVSEYLLTNGCSVQ